MWSSFKNRAPESWTPYQNPQEGPRTGTGTKLRKAGSPEQARDAELGESAEDGDPHGEHEDDADDDDVESEHEDVLQPEGAAGTRGEVGCHAKHRR